MLLFCCSFTTTLHKTNSEHFYSGFGKNVFLFSDKNIDFRDEVYLQGGYKLGLHFLVKKLCL